MKPKQKNTTSDGINVNNSRRDFLKTLGVVTAGGLSTLALPEALKASNDTMKLLANAQGNLSEELYWKKVRSQFPLRRDIIYLNTGTEGSMSYPVLRHIQEDFLTFAQWPMNEIIYDEDDKMTCDKIRQAVGDFVGAGVDEITINTNTTEGLSWAANGLDLQPDDEVITTLHFDPYNSCWQLLSDRGRITLIELELPTPAKNKDEIIASFEKAITPKTKVMTFCHINFSTGLRMPVKELCQLAKEHGIITVVDGAHAIGMIDFSLHDLGCDIYAGSLHKWICGPPGAGFFYIRKDMQDKVWPIEFDSYMGKGIKIFMNFQLRGQQCTPAYAGVLNAIELHNTIGKDRIEARVMALHNYCKGTLKEIYGEDKIFSPAGDELSTGLFSFNPFDDPHEGVGGGKISSLYYGLYFKENNKKKNITTRSISFKDKLTDSLPKKALRISTHIYNNYDEIDSTIEMIQELVTNIKNGATYGPPK